MDILLTILIGIFSIISSLLVFDINNRYSTQTKILKAFPRLIMGIQFLIVPILFDNASVIVVDVGFYSLSDQIRIILWSILIFLLTEIVLQILNIKFGRSGT